MGANLALHRAFPLHDSNSRSFPLEFSLAAIFPFDSGDLWRRSAAWHRLPGDERGQDAGASLRLDRAFSRGLYGARDVDIRHSRLLRFSPNLALNWTSYALVFLGIFITLFRISAVDTCSDHVLCIACYICL